MFNKKFLIITTYIQLITFLTITFHSFAAPDFKLDPNTSGQAEYFNSNRNKRMLIRINLISGVQKTGIHYVPDDTNLIDLISLAGGVTSGAEADDISVRREGKNGTETLRIDLTQIISNSDLKVPTLMNNDTLFIPESTNFRQNLMLQIGMITAILSLVSLSLSLYTTLSK
jgi:hypothetical protein